ncbi:sulfurtransferase-like selenium metabolism protein YedF [Peptoniphilus indolicus]|uniref:Selenium metabolism protein YedF n=2 Tax=Peptoniphilus indolicus TaxID=33030 RepID=G4D2N7_9FIRM|nr:sulfurtransferase-like selenium metabolism protein YedF [Peptoniphilus indolicus]EGY80220.1 selenium metabolism protein YedF [Peptoniphilus indolicus ATCC 29427]SUB75249.1 selenium metabolism protein YedF [Peptoniphilus indolicus]
MKEINAMGHACPRPVIMTKKAIVEENLEEVLVKVDNEIATENLSKMAEQLGFSAEVNKISNAEYEVVMNKKEGVCSIMEIQPETDEFIVVFSSNELGGGEESFSKTLLNGFVYALTEQDRVPKYVVCYNKGVEITTINEKTVEDLKVLEQKGTEILSCGLCLENYGLKEKLKIGTATNMYRICELQLKYKTVKPC